MKAVYLPAPIYPMEARDKIPAGVVSVMIEVSEQGLVTKAKACAGHAMLRLSVEEAARRAQISMTFLSGTPVKVNGLLVYRFEPQKAYIEPVVLRCSPTVVSNLKVLNGYAIDLVRPDQPDTTDHAGTTVSVVVLVDEMGKIEKAEAVSGDTRFRKSAEEAAKRSKFRPFIRCGKPTKISSVVIYSFPRS